MVGMALSRADAAWQSLKEGKKQFGPLHHLLSKQDVQESIKNTSSAQQNNSGSGRERELPFGKGTRELADGCQNVKGDAMKQPNEVEETDSRASTSGRTSEETDLFFRVGCKTDLLRQLNALTDPSAAVRKQALRQLKKGLLVEKLHVSKEELQDFVETQALKPLLRRYGDSSAACREQALELTIGLLEQVPDAVLSLLPYAIPTLGERLARYDGSDFTNPSSLQEASSDLHRSTTDSTTEERTKVPARKRGSGPVEEVEENRLLLAKLLRAVLRHSGKAIGAYAADVAAMLMSSVADASPEVAQELCACCNDYAAQLGVRLRQVAKSMIASVTPLLGAKRQKVRCAALRAVRKLVACGGSEAILDLTGFRDPNLIPIKAFYEADIKTNWFALLALDPTVQVRREFLATLGDWLLNLLERNDYETRLLPYVLSAFSDSNPTVQSEAFELMEAIGRLYEKEKEDELKDTRFYLPEETANEGQLLSFKLPAPFTRRPCLGARICVRGCFNRLILPLLEELKAWTTGTKEHAVDLLRTMLVYVEENATQNVQPILLAFLQSSEDSSIAEKVKDCCRILGTFVPPSAYLLVLLPRIQGDLGNVDARARARALALLADLLSAASADRIRSVLLEITSVLTEPGLLEGASARPRAAAGRVLREVLRVWRKDGDEGTWQQELVPMLWILLHLESQDKDEMTAENFSSMETLARAEGFRTVGELLSAKVDSLLPLLSPASTWHPHSRDLDIFCRIKALVQKTGQKSQGSESLVVVEEEAKLSLEYDAIKGRLEGADEPTRVGQDARLVL